MRIDKPMRLTVALFFFNIACTEVLTLDGQDSGLNTDTDKGAEHNTEVERDSNQDPGDVQNTDENKTTDNDTDDQATDNDTDNQITDSDTDNQATDSDTDNQATDSDTDNQATDSDTDNNYDSDDDTDDNESDNADSESETGFGKPIIEFGTGDIVFDISPIVSPKKDLPPLEGKTLNYTPAHASEQLPDASEGIQRLEEVAEFFRYYGNEEELASALRNKGVVRQTNGFRSHIMYKHVQTLNNYPDMSVFIASDVLLNTFHIFFDNLLLAMEKDSLRGDLLALVTSLKNKAAVLYNSFPEGKTKDAALDVVAYFQVAHTLLDPDGEMIREVSEVVSQEIELIMKHSGPAPSPIFNRLKYSKGFCSVDYCFEDHLNCMICSDESALPCAEGLETLACPERHSEDYSQYNPRGHYTYSEELSQYFRAMMWLGRMTFFNRSPQSTRGSIITLDSIKSAKAEIGDKTENTINIWRRILRIIGTCVGGMDDLTIDEIDNAVSPILGSDFELSKLDDDDLIKEVQLEVSKLRDPAILSGILSASAEVGAATKGFRLLGQSFLPDSYALGQLVFRNVGASSQKARWVDAVGLCNSSGYNISLAADPSTLSYEETVCVCDKAFYEGRMSKQMGNLAESEEWFDVCRGMPSGLDVASVFGHSGAKEKSFAKWGDYAHYKEQVNSLSNEIDNFDIVQWGSSIAWSWLYALKGLLADVDEGAPAFMRTESWSDKTLETGLTSWSEMRHDTVLYAKQSYTDGDTDGDADIDTGDEIYLDFDYIEPQPDAYSRLAAAASRLKAIAVTEGVLSENGNNVDYYLNQFIELLESASEISIKELQGETLSNADVQWIKNLGFRIEHLANSFLNGIGVTDPDMTLDSERLSTRIITDVHTFSSKEAVLQVGSGYLANIAVLHRHPSGQWGVAVGPVYSYREFEHPMADRLTDEKWQEMLESEIEYGLPDWLR